MSVIFLLSFPLFPCKYIIPGFCIRYSLPTLLKNSPPYLYTSLQRTSLYWLLVNSKKQEATRSTREAYLYPLIVNHFVSKVYDTYFLYLSLKTNWVEPKLIIFQIMSLFPFIFVGRSLVYNENSYLLINSSPMGTIIIFTTITLYSLHFNFSLFIFTCDT